MAADLFGETPKTNDRAKRREAAKPDGKPRFVEADRKQIHLRPVDLEDLIGADHPARAIWALLDELNLSAFYESILARGSHPGRPAIDPRILLALWLFATSEGVGSARELERLCSEHKAYQWLRGGVSVNYHTLSDFRSERKNELDRLLTQILAVLMEKKLIDLHRVSQDGLRVRASAGASSFRRRKRLKDYLKEAKKQVEWTSEHAEDAELSARKKAAQQRAASERLERVKGALASLKKLEEQRAEQDGGRRAKSEPRASVTDADARNMRMGDSGFRPAYNVQLATTVEGGVIVGVSVSNSGSDQGEAELMIQQVEERTGERPKEILVDGGYTGKKSLGVLAEKDVTVYGPASARWGQGPLEPQKGDTVEVGELRKRMATEAGKEIYKLRGATSERVNADVRTRRTLDRFLVRGLDKVLTVALLNAVTFNILRWVTLRTLQ
jgi:transposase